MAIKGLLVVEALANFILLSTFARSVIIPYFFPCSAIHRGDKVVEALRDSWLSNPLALLARRSFPLDKYLYIDEAHATQVSVKLSSAGILSLMTIKSQIQVRYACSCVVMWLGKLVRFSWTSYTH
ncbi:hypothetical protein SCLCIDRAFT_739052 [Scleroderma citrinum Foug A]|uniref:Uncharacterized protein n=1 Tax=Scleroderma citrinum Foug A TaxID=1036808 RepID=A0A0C3DSW5_9AGAM|nr:hypothetical protein SCLCIDRAFT_739052 [Scleroderma citrinum Foug A]